MTQLRRFASAALTLTAVLFPAAARADSFPGVPLPDPSPPAPAPRFPGIPLASSAELPPPDSGRYDMGTGVVEKHWYGWHVLLPTAVFDGLMVAGVLTSLSSTPWQVGLGLGVTGMVGHGISGPIVHLVHGHPLRALASFGAEAVLPGAMIGVAMATPCTSSCGAQIFTLLVGVPVAFSAGTAVDAAAIAWEDRPVKNRMGLASLSVAPLALAPARAGSTARPLGAALVGSF